MTWSRPQADASPKFRRACDFQTDRPRVTNNVVSDFLSRVWTVTPSTLSCLAALATAGLIMGACGTDTKHAGAADSGSPDDGPPGPPAHITTIAGKNGESGFADGDAASARFAYPEGLVLDPAGENLYVADMNNHAIRRIELATMKVTTVGGVGTFQGSNDTAADGSKALLHQPRNMVLDPTGTGVYFTDSGNFVIRHLDLATSKVTTVFGKTGAPGTADGVGQEARFGSPELLNPWSGGLAIDTSGAKPTMYVADNPNHAIRSIDLTSGEVKTIAGHVGVAGSADGIGTAATFNKPSGLALDGAGKLYVTDANNIDIRQIDLATMNVVRVAGKAPDDPNHFCENLSPVLPPECGAIDGASGLDARFRFPFSAALDHTGGFFVVDSHNDLIRHFDMKSTAVTTVAGKQITILNDYPQESLDTTATQHGTFSHPTHAVFKAPNILFVADRSASCIRRVEIGVQ